MYERKKAGRVAVILISLIVVAGAMTGTAFGTEKSGSQQPKELGKLIRNDKHISYRLNDPSLLMPGGKSIKYETKGLPRAFDLRTEGRVTPVKDQGVYSTCWAFGALSSMESGLIKKGITQDLSERHLAWFAYHGKNSDKDKSKYAGLDTFYDSENLAYDEGGGRFLAVPTLARGYGAVKESSAPYDPYDMKDLSGSLRTKSEIRLANAIYLPEPARYTVVKGIYAYRGFDSKAAALVKACIRDKGAVSMSYYSWSESDDNAEPVGSKQEITPNPYWNEAKNSYYYDGEFRSNHEISVVGWNDDYPASAFAKKPPGNGAWIIKNSWGTDFGEKGYFYLSYYDHSYEAPTYYEAQQAASTPVYKQVYQYDGVGMDASSLTENSRISGANCYTARQDELIKGVGVYAPVADSNITVTVYTSPSANNPARGKKYQKTFKRTYAGYSTLDLGTSIGIPKGYKFSVTVTASYKEKGTTVYSMPFEFKILWGIAAAYPEKAIKGQSFVCKKGKWKDVIDYDMGSDYSMRNALIKAFSVECGTKSQAVDVKSNKMKTYGCKAFELGAKRTAGGGRLLYRTSNEKVATVSTSGTVDVKAPGIVSLYVAASPSATYKSAVKKVILTVKPKKTAITYLKSNKTKALTIKWKKDKTVTGYQVVIAKNKKFTSGKKSYTSKKNSTISKMFTKLSSKKTYYVKVRGYKNSAGKKVYGDYTDVKKAIVMK